MQIVAQTAVYNYVSNVSQGVLWQGSTNQSPVQVGDAGQIVYHSVVWSGVCVASGARCGSQRMYALQIVRDVSPLGRVLQRIAWQRRRLLQSLPHTVLRG